MVDWSTPGSGPGRGTLEPRSRDDRTVAITCCSFASLASLWINFRHKSMTRISTSVSFSLSTCFGHHSAALFELVFSIFVHVLITSPRLV